MVMLSLLLAMTLAHPLHTTLTELTEDRAHGVVRATVRVFADDFGTVLARRGVTGDAAATNYVSSSFTFVDAAGRKLPATSCGIRRTGDLYWVCIEAPSAAGLAGLKVRAAVLCDLYDDQVNVVQGVVAGSRRSLLFVKGDAAKGL
ncbi:MAG: DUF6702 family protein [Gemmatimonadaceae bacterium]